MRQSLRFFENMPQADPGRYPILTGAQRHFLIRIRPSSIDQSDIDQKMGEEVFTLPWSLEIAGLTVNGHGLSSQGGTRPIGIGTYDQAIFVLYGGLGVYTGGGWAPEAGVGQVAGL